MKKYLISILCLVTLVLSCRQKKEENKKFISVLSLIENQVAHVDTALYSIKKIVFIDSLRSDTSYIPRENFREEAKDFLSIPDLSDKKVAKRYKDEPARYDEMLNRVIITYTALNPEKEEVKKQQLLVIPGTASGDKVNSIIISRILNNRNGFLQKEMLWQMDKSFQVVTTSQLPGEPEKITVVKVTWNEEDNP